MTSFLKKIGFANPDGSPSEIYKRFRNPATASAAVEEALKIGYKPLYNRNEYMHKLPDSELKGLLIEETGHEADSSALSCQLGCIRALKKFVAESSIKELATTKIPTGAESKNTEGQKQQSQDRTIGLNLAYTINLNLPATPDIAVFNAIFKSLKENLLRSSDE